MGRPFRSYHTKEHTDLVPRTDSNSVRCRDCRRIYGQLYRSRPENARRTRINNRIRHLRERYGLSMEEADQLFATHDGLCWLCMRAEARHIDHDHQTGRVRGVLCINCNTGLHTIDKLPLDDVLRYLSYSPGESYVTDQCSDSHPTNPATETAHSNG